MIGLFRNPCSGFRILFFENLEISESRDELQNRAKKLEMTFLEQYHRRNADDRFGHRVNAEDRVFLDGQPIFPVTVTGGLKIDQLPTPPD